MKIQQNGCAKGDGARSMKPEKIKLSVKFDILNNSIDKLNENINDLSDSLLPILQENVSDKFDSSDKSPTNVNTSDIHSDFYKRFEILDEQICKMIGKVQNLLERSEV